MSSNASDDSFRSAHSPQSSSVHSQTSTLEYGHESFATFHDKVECLCRTLWSDSAANFKIERGPGGSYNRVIAITIHRSRSPTRSEELILRIPRFDGARIDREIAAVRFVRQNSNLTVPEAVASDTTPNNALQLPYVIQNRLPGVSLHTVFPSLSHQQKLRIARSIGQVLARLLRITSPVSGVIEELPENEILDQPIMIPEQQQRSLFKHFLQALARKAKSKVTSRAVKAFRGPRQAFIVRPFEIKGPNHDELGAAENTPADVQIKTPTEGVVQMLLEQFMRWKADWLKTYPGDGTMAEYYDRFAATAKEMQRLGLLEDDDVFTLCHLDLAPRNILVEIKTEDLPTSSSISLTGVLDWDSAVFAPRIMSCAPPSWIWAWAEDESEDEAAANDIPPTTAAQELKRTFEAAVGDDFLRLCYEPHHRLARRLIRLAIFGMHSNEELKDADDLLEEWKRVSLKFTTGGVGDGI